MSVDQILELAGMKRVLLSKRQIKILISVLEDNIEMSSHLGGETKEETELLDYLKGWL